MGGTVEYDETYVGGKPRHKGKNKRGWGTEKQPVFSAVERGGDVRTKVVANVTAKTLKAAIQEYVDGQARIITDENRSYNGLHTEFAGGHETVCQGAKEYARGDVNTNSIEGFFAIFKRGLYGIWHNVSKEHLHPYLAEAEFRFNSRHLNDGERMVAAIRAAEGKRLMYKVSIQ